MNLLLSVLKLLLLISTPLRAEDFEINGSECGISGNPKLIINGSDARPDQFPWMVRIKSYMRRGRRITCGGSIVTRRHVLTAAHCLTLRGETPVKVEVLYGSNDATRAKKIVVEKILIQPRFSHLSMSNDIAIVLVKEPFQYSRRVRPVCLPRSNMDVVGADAVASGWGYTKPAGLGAKYLRYTTLKVVPDKICEELYFKQYRSGAMLCAQRDGTGICRGDAGGPLSVKVKTGRFVQVGITSYSSGRCKSIGNVFTRVEAFMTWIKKNIGNHALYEDLTPHWQIPRMPMEYPAEQIPVLSDDEMYDMPAVYPPF